MSINSQQLLEYVINPTLDMLGLNSPVAARLLLGTCAQESHMGTYIKQIKGPALGIYQMEPATHADIKQNFLTYKPELLAKINRLGDGADTSLIYNLAYATALCRIHYFRVKAPLPDGNDLNGLAYYWKKYYNTPQGKGTEQEFIENYRRYVQ